MLCDDRTINAFSVRAPGNPRFIWPVVMISERDTGMQRKAKPQNSGVCQRRPLSDIYLVTRLAKAAAQLDTTSPH